MTEEWRSVIGYEGYYEVSDHGRVRAVSRVIPTARGVMRLRARMMTPTPDAHGYPRVRLSKANKARNSLVHHLVLEAFVGPRPPGLCRLHADDDPANNCLANLRYGTYADNERDKLLNGNNPFSSKTHCKRGHQFTPENTYRNNKSHHRRCRQCNLDRCRQRRLKESA